MVYNFLFQQVALVLINKYAKGIQPVHLFYASTLSTLSIYEHRRIENSSP